MKCPHCKVDIPGENGSDLIDSLMEHLKEEREKKIQAVKEKVQDRIEKMRKENAKPVIILNSPSIWE